MYRTQIKNLIEKLRNKFTKGSSDSSNYIVENLKLIQEHLDRNDTNMKVIDKYVGGIVKLTYEDSSFLETSVAREVLELCEELVSKNK